MISRKKAIVIRKAHRYLGLFLGIQFVLWTVSGLYFSWTDIDEIHGDHFKQLPPERTAFTDLLGTSELQGGAAIETLQLLEIDGHPYYWVNESSLYHARTGDLKEGITQTEAIAVAKRHMSSDLRISSIQKLDSVGPHHEYRGRPLPAYEISYASSKNVKAYVAVNNGAFQTVRFRDWRWFDFLWMTHTMDYQGRDDFNTLLLRVFSLAGLITVLSGFVLWSVSSPTLRKLFKRGRA